MTPEKKVKNKVMKVLNAVGCYSFYPQTGGYGNSGIPDIIACVKGRFIAIECKAGTNKTTALQDYNLQQIKDNGGLAIVVNEDNIVSLIELIRGITENE